MRIIAFTLFLLNISTLNAQWSELGGVNSLSEYSYVNSICSDKSGNVYVSGNFINQPSNGPYISKWDGQSWSKLKGINATLLGSICTDENGFLFAVTYSPTQQAVSKWDGNMWTDLGGPLVGEIAFPGKISTDGKGNLYVSANDTNGIPFVARWNSVSNWTILGSFIGYTACKCITSICTDKAGNIYATGGFTNSAGNYYVANWNGSTWEEVGGLNGLASDSLINTIHSDTFGNLFAAGNFTNSSGNLFVAKWNGTKWSESIELAPTFKDEFIGEVCSDPTGNLYVGGFLWSNSEPFVGKWNGSSLIQLSGGQSSHFFFGSMCTDPTGNLYAAGFAKNGLPNKFVAIYPNAKYVGIDNQQLVKAEIKLFPNPATNSITIQVEGIPGANGEITVCITDLLGHKLFESDAFYSTSILDLSDFSPGFYIVSVKINGRWYKNKILKE
jgi:hypothetical protein